MQFGESVLEDFLPSDLSLVGEKVHDFFQIRVIFFPDLCTLGWVLVDLLYFLIRDCLHQQLGLRVDHFEDGLVRCLDQVVKK